jgi:threonine dehydrogenase-like Zn-dependent dehydrogenase
MKAIVMKGPGTSELVEMDIPKINDDQMLVKLKYTGLCHSDWMAWKVGVPGTRIGHEPIGVVVEVGKNVTGFKVGDRVTGLGAGYCEYIVMLPRFAVHIPDGLAFEDADGQPLGCLLSAVSKVPVQVVNDPMVVVGCGFMGLGAISLLKKKGAGPIVAVDPREEMRAHALEYGATEVYAPEEVPAGYKLNWDNYRADHTRTGKSINIFEVGFPAVLEFAGTEPALRLAGEMVTAHGMLGIGGYHDDCDRTIDFKLWNIKALTVINCHERREDYLVHCVRNAINMLASGEWEYKGVHTNIYAFDELDKANAELVTKPQGFIKGLVRCEF